MPVPSGEDFVKKMISAARQNARAREWFSGCVACAVAILHDETPTEADKKKFVLSVRGYANAESFVLNDSAEFYQEAMEALIIHIQARGLHKQKPLLEYSELRTDEGDE